jgi:hypothetical protein
MALTHSTAKHTKKENRGAIKMNCETIHDKIHDATIKAISESLDIPEGHVEDRFEYMSYYEIPKANEDGSFTYEVELGAFGSHYDVEVYNNNGTFTGDCWRVNGKLNDQLILDS